MTLLQLVESHSPKPDPRPRPPVALASRGASEKATVHVFAGYFETSAYTAHDATMNGLGVTATGVPVTSWQTVAVDPDIIPLGTKLYVPYFKDAPNKGVFVAHDTGGMIRGYMMDIFMSNLDDALAFGRRDLEVYIIEE